LDALGVLQALMTGAWQLEELADADGRHALITCSVAVIAQNT
jgi:hypothetical protein